MKLVLPTIQYKQSYLEAVEEGKDETAVTIIDKPEENQSFEEFVEHQKGKVQGLHLPEGWVPATEFWLIDNDAFIGRVNVRHSLTEFLLKVGGHIGYWIRPSQRNKGYGKEILQLALPEAKKLGIGKVLVTCDDTNLGSQKIIEANGGILENSVDMGEENPKKMRYWIELN